MRRTDDGLRAYTRETDRVVTAAARGRGPLQRLILIWLARYPGTPTPDLTKRFASQGYEAQSVRRSIRGLHARGVITREPDGGWIVAQACATGKKQEQGS